MTDDELIEELARVIEHGLAFDTERDVYASETCVEERRCIAARILPIIKRERAAETDLLREALSDMCAEFRAYDLPYGSKAYAKGIAALNGHKHD